MQRSPKYFGPYYHRESIDAFGALFYQHQSLHILNLEDVSLHAMALNHEIISYLI
jgi:hypothetical protein